MINTRSAQTIDNLNLAGATGTEMQVEENTQPENECIAEQTQGNGKEAEKMKMAENEETNEIVSGTPQTERHIKPQTGDRGRNDYEAGEERMTTERRGKDDNPTHHNGPTGQKGRSTTTVR
jgi:hypothetical protein